MRLTTRTRYAIRAMVYLGNQVEGKAIPLTEIARRQRIKPRYLEQILMQLRHARLIKSKKGPGGGYFINRDPKSIKLSEILAAVGESVAPVGCAEDRIDRYCARLKSCSISPYWKNLKRVIDEFFETSTLGDACHGSKNTP